MINLRLFYFDVTKWRIKTLPNKGKKLFLGHIRAFCNNSLALNKSKKSKEPLTVMC